MSKLHPVREELYKKWVEDYGLEDPRAVGWVNKEALDKRFFLTINLIDYDSKEMSVLDFGCGVSLNLLKYINPDRYLGVDCLPSSLHLAQEKHSIPIIPSHHVASLYSRGLMLDTDFYEAKYLTFDRIVCQGVYQEFNHIQGVRENLRILAGRLRPNGVLVTMTPANRKGDFDGRSVLRLSAYDLISISEEIGLPYELHVGKLGEHLALKIYNRSF